MISHCSSKIQDLTGFLAGWQDARDPVLAQDFNAYERGLEAQLAGPLERLGADRPVDAARTVIELMRGFELERLTRPNTSTEDLRRRIEVVVCALTGIKPAGGA